jgi:hypothetical protein
MDTFVKIKDAIIPATIFGTARDPHWDDRPSKTITMESDYGRVIGLFEDDTPWFIITEHLNEEGEIIQEQYDNSEYSVAGPVTDYRDGTISVKMGKETTLEKMFQIIYGGAEE